MQALLDVNVLLALASQQHVFHEPAHAWFTRRAKDGWATTPVTQNGFLRILTTPRFPNRLPMDDAIALLKMYIAHPDHQFWPDNISVMDERFFAPANLRYGEAVTDVYLLGLAVSRNARLVTFDRRISRLAVPSATPEQLEVLMPVRE